MAKKCKVYSIVASFHPEPGQTIAEKTAEFLNKNNLDPKEVIAIPQAFVGDGSPVCTRLDIVYFDKTGIAGDVTIVSAAQ